MRILRDFLIGLAVIIISPILLLLVFIGWQVIVGLSSFILIFISGSLFLLLVFYLITLIGYLIRSIFTKE